MSTAERANDVVEACADALLTAAGLTLLIGDDEGKKITDVHQVWDVATAALRKVLMKTWQEGPRA